MIYLQLQYPISHIRHPPPLSISRHSPGPMARAAVLRHRGVRNMAESGSDNTEMVKRRRERPIQSCPNHENPPPMPCQSKNRPTVLSSVTACVIHQTKRYLAPTWPRRELIYNAASLVCQRKAPLFEAIYITYMAPLNDKACPKARNPNWVNGHRRLLAVP